MPEIHTWESMRQRIHSQLERQTGAGVAEWKSRIDVVDPSDEPSLRAWLEEAGVTGYPQMLLVFETFGYPDFLLATADELVDAQYADRPDLRPIFDSVIAAASSFGQVSVQARKTYVSLLTPRRTFAVVQATTKKRVDVGLRLSGVEPGGRLLAGGSVGNDAINLRVGLETLDDLDTDALAWLRRAYDESN